MDYGVITPAHIAETTKRFPVVAILWVLAFTSLYGTAVRMRANVTKMDFSVYYLSAILTYQGDNPYVTSFEPLAKKRGLEVGWIGHATDPPPFLLCIAPLALLPERSAYYAWTVLNVAMFGVALTWLLLNSGLSPPAILAIGALALFYPPVQFHFFMGQSKIVILLLLVAMMRSMERGLDCAAGLCLAMASLLRVFPLLLALYLVIQRRWRVLVWTFAGVTIGCLATLAICPLDKFLSFAHGITLLADRRLVTQCTNISLRAAVTRLVWLVAKPGIGVKVDAAVRAAVFATDAGLLGVTAWATARLGPRNDPDWRAFSLWIIASVLMSPVAWMHYMVLFLIPFVQLTKAAGLDRASTRAEWSAIASYVFIAFFPWFFRRAMNWDPHYGQPTVLIMVMYIQCLGAALLGYLAAYWLTLDVRLSDLRRAALP
jgi:hypothetical protein